METRSEIISALWPGPMRVKVLQSRLRIPERTLYYHLQKLRQKELVLRPKKGLYGLRARAYRQQADLIEIPPMPKLTPKPRYWPRVVLACLILGLLSYGLGRYGG